MGMHCRFEVVGMQVDKGLDFTPFGQCGSKVWGQCKCVITLSCSFPLLFLSHLCRYLHTALGPLSRQWMSRWWR